MFYTNYSTVYHRVRFKEIAFPQIHRIAQLPKSKTCKIKRLERP